MLKVDRAAKKSDCLTTDNLFLGNLLLTSNFKEDIFLISRPGPFEQQVVYYSVYSDAKPTR
jgi:hypothetical protein